MITVAISGSSICQTMAGIGRHCQNSRSRVRLASRNIGAPFDRFQRIASTIVLKRFVTANPLC